MLECTKVESRHRTIFSRTPTNIAKCSEPLSHPEMLYISGKIKKLELISVTLIAVSIIMSIFIIRSYYEENIRQYMTESFLYKEALEKLQKKVSMPRYPFATNYERKDYHDYIFMEYEATRVGPGESGRKYVLTDPSDIERSKEQEKFFGFSTTASDHISVNRSLPDIRLPSCSNKKYLKQLSKVSIIIVFFDEYWSVLLRTIHSIYNRTPHELIHEIILINDNSTIDELYEPLQAYVRRNFNGVVKIFTMKERRGLAMCRIEGARLAKGEVLVFLDAQVEVNVNWLPPLLEPIALTPKLITTPIVDNFAYDTFEYRKTDDGGRGIFNWDLQYRRFPRRSEDLLKLDKPIPNPVMVGSAFAINKQNFWDLGSYDNGLKVWQGEQLELSFKAHLCGQGMVEVPCSRIAHSFKSDKYYKRFGDDGQDYMIRNFKRIAEVWLDEYKDVVFSRNRVKYDEADAGDLTRAKAVHRGLHCKPFRYFLEFVAPEMLERYPLKDPGCYAQGCIQSKVKPQLCVEVSKPHRKAAITLNNCEEKLVTPSPKQFFKLSFHNNLQHFIYDFCLRDSLTMSECHFKGGNQFWLYDLETFQIIQPRLNVTQCLTMNKEGDGLSLEVCETQNEFQKWNWGEKNISALTAKN